MPAEGEPEASMREQSAPISPSSTPINGYAVSNGRAGSFWYRLKALFGIRENEGSLKEALQEVLQEHAEELVQLPAEERQIFSNLIGFGDVEVSEIMTPQPDIIALEIDGTLQDLKEVLLKERHTRMPVYEETIDQVKGFIHVKDLVPFLGTSVEGFQVRDILREILFVPPAMKIVDLLLKMRSEGVHIAIVVDEYGGTQGLITLEDLFEEIVGDIQDEHDDEEPEEVPLCWDETGELVVDAKTRIEDLEKDLDVQLYTDPEEDDYETIGGLVFAQMGKIPARGETSEHPSGIRIEVLDADVRRIKKVRLIRNNEGNRIGQAVSG